MQCWYRKTVQLGVRGAQLAVILAVLWSARPANLRAQTREDIAIKSHRAAQAMTVGRYDEASALYAELVQAHPEEPRFRLNLGLALHSSGRYREAVEQFRAFLKQQPDSSPAWFLLGMDCLKLNRPSQAVVPLDRAVRSDPANKIARLELSQALLLVNRLEDALANIQKVTELDPNDPQAWQATGLVYNALSRRAFGQLEESAPGSDYFDVLLARSLVERNQFLRAFSIYKQARNHGSNLRALYEGLAELYAKTQHPDWALTERQRERDLPPPDCSTANVECEFMAGHFPQVLRLTGDSKGPEAFYWQSQAYAELSRQAFERLAQMPPSAAIHDLLAEAYRVQGKYELSVQEWREALRLTPEDRKQREGLARALWLNHQYQDAEPLLAELVRQQPESPPLNYELGDTLLRGESADKALPYLEKTVKLDPENKEAQADLGRAYMWLNQPDKAIPYFKSALDLDREGTIYYQLAQAYQKLGRKELAAHTMQQFQEISKAAAAKKPQSVAEFQITPP
jgi:predicted Zn-dependent protease